jgi:hypothetical protein
VLDALARALQLDDEATAHLHALAGPERRVRRFGQGPERVSPSIQQLIEGWQGTPAFVQDRRLDVLGANPLAIGPDIDDPLLNELVGELSVRSDHFRSLWARHDIRVRISGGTRHMYHPQVGELELHYENLQIAGTNGQTLIIYHADPGSRTAQALALLATLAENCSPSSAPTEKPALPPNRDPRRTIVPGEGPSARSSRGEHQPWQPSRSQVSPGSG